MNKNLKTLGRRAPAWEKLIKNRFKGSFQASMMPLRLFSLKYSQELRRNNLLQLRRRFSDKMSIKERIKREREQRMNLIDEVMPLKTESSKIFLKTHFSNQMLRYPKN